MSIILSLSKYEGSIWAAGPYGLFAVGEEELTPTPATAGKADHGL